MAEQWERIQVAYPVGTIVHGQVTRLFPMGAGIVLADGPVGYLPDPELSWLREISAFKRTLEIGQVLKLTIIGLDANRRGLIFSHRQCTVSPWLDPEICPMVGIEYKGVVTNIVDFGAFICLPNGLEGLLHKSVLPPGWRFEPNQIIGVIVTAIDHQKQRMVLTLTKN